MRTTGRIAQNISTERRGVGKGPRSLLSASTTIAPSSFPVDEDGGDDGREAVWTAARMMNSCETAQDATAIQKIASRSALDMSTKQGRQEWITHQRVEPSQYSRLCTIGHCSPRLTMPATLEATETIMKIVPFGAQPRARSQVLL